MNGWNWLVDDIAERVALEEKAAKLREIDKKIDALKQSMEVSNV